MPLYECQQCHCKENTALANYWSKKSEGKPLLCSACDPDIAAWHGCFPQEPADDARREHPEWFVDNPPTNNQ